METIIYANKNAQAESAVQEGEQPKLELPTLQQGGKSLGIGHSGSSSYWARRKRNNEAAKRCRERRRLDELVLKMHAFELLKENQHLRATLCSLYPQHKVRHRVVPTVSRPGKAFTMHPGHNNMHYRPWTAFPLHQSIHRCQPPPSFGHQPPPVMVSLPPPTVLECHSLPSTLACHSFPHSLGPTPSSPSLVCNPPPTILGCEPLSQTMACKTPILESLSPPTLECQFLNHAQKSQPSSSSLRRSSSPPTTVGSQPPPSTLVSQISCSTLGSQLPFSNLGSQFPSPTQECQSLSTLCTLPSSPTPEPLPLHTQTYPQPTIFQECHASRLSQNVPAQTLHKASTDYITPSCSSLESTNCPMSTITKSPQCGVPNPAPLPLLPHKLRLKGTHVLSSWAKAGGF